MRPHAPTSASLSVLAKPACPQVSSVRQELEAIEAELAEANRDLRAAWPSALGGGSDLAALGGGEGGDGENAGGLDADKVGWRSLRKCRVVCATRCGLVQPK